MTGVFFSDQNTKWLFVNVLPFEYCFFTRMTSLLKSKNIGEVDGNKVPNGQGCLEFPGNDDLERQIYEGDFKDKKAHGKGLMRWRQGDKYEGEFQNGLRHGKGLYFSKVNELLSRDSDTRL